MFGTFKERIASDALDFRVDRILEIIKNDRDPLRINEEKAFDLQVWNVAVKLFPRYNKETKELFLNHLFNMLSR